MGRAHAAGRTSSLRAVEATILSAGTEGHHSEELQARVASTSLPALTAKRSSRRVEGALAELRVPAEAHSCGHLQAEVAAHLLQVGEGADHQAEGVETMIHHQKENKDLLEAEYANLRLAPSRGTVESTALCEEAG